MTPKTAVKEPDLAGGRRKKKNSGKGKGRILDEMPEPR